MVALARCDKILANTRKGILEGFQNQSCVCEVSGLRIGLVMQGEGLCPAGTLSDDSVPVGAGVVQSGGGGSPVARGAS